MSQAKRQHYGDGGVYQRASDGLWIGTVEAGYTRTGARRRITVSAKTEAAARRKLRDKRLQIDRDGLPGAGQTRTTVKAWAEAWIEGRKTDVRGKPWATDASAIRRWIVPTIGHKRLADLTPADLRAVATAQRRAGRSTSTALRTHTTLTGILRAAMLEGHQVPARVLLVKGPGIAANDRLDMPDAELLLCLSAAYGLLPHWSRWLFQAFYGVRPGEALGLTRDAIDLDRGTVRIEWQLQPLRYVDRTNKALGFQTPDGLKVKRLVDSWHLVEVKTKKGERVLPLVPAMRAALVDWLAVAPENPWGLVWPTCEGRPANEKHDRDEWHALQGTVGVHHPNRLTNAGDPAPYHAYEMRHGLATRLMEEGVDEHVITALMGHSSIVTSRGYQHVKLRLALEAMEKVTARLQLDTPREFG